MISLVQDSAGVDYINYILQNYGISGILVMLAAYFGI